MGRGKMREFLFIITKRKQNKAGNEIQVLGIYLEKWRFA